MREAMIMVVMVTVNRYAFIMASECTDTSVKSIKVSTFHSDNDSVMIHDS